MSIEIPEAPAKSVPIVNLELGAAVEVAKPKLPLWEIANCLVVCPLTFHTAKVLFSSAPIPPCPVELVVLPKTNWIEAEAALNALKKDLNISFPA